MTSPCEQPFGVFLHERLIGYLYRHGDVTRFVFDPGYWGDPDRSVLGLRFEDDPHARHQAKMRLPPWFSNLLPEGRLREWIAMAHRTSVQREMDLLAQVGHDLPGAVQVLPSDDVISLDIAEDATAEESGTVSNDRLWSFSLAGVGLKFSMLSKGDRLTVPGVGEGGDWILKLPDSRYPDVPLNELAMMTLAGAVGIEVPEVRLVHREQVVALPDRVWMGGEERAYAVRRFDRGSKRERIHIEDMAQVRGFYPDASRGNPGKYAGSFETVGALVYRRRDREALREFARRLAFNVLIGNGDAHLKNWSLIYRDPRIPTLAPAYDLVSTFVYRPDEQGPEDMGLKFGRTRRFEDVRLSSFEAMDRRLGAQADLADVVNDLTVRIREAWPIAAMLLETVPELCGRVERHIRERVAQLR